MATDLAQSLISGYQAGAHIAQERRRIQAEESRTQAEASARATTAAREAQVEQQRIRIEAAISRPKPDFGNRHRGDQAKAVNDQRTQAAAMKYAAVQGLAKDLESGVPMEQAMYRNPGASSPSDMVAAQRAAESLKQQRDSLKLRQDEFAERQRQNEFTRNKTSTGRDENVKILVPGQGTGANPVLTTMPRSQATNVVAGLPVELQQNPVNSALMPKGVPLTSQNAPNWLKPPVPGAAPADGKKRYRWDPKKNDLVDILAGQPAATAAAGNVAPPEPGDETPPDDRE